jgi:Domain of unknown function (DUF4410)
VSIIRLASLLLVLASLPVTALAQQEEPKAAETANASAKTVYVSDFDLDVLNAKDDKIAPPSSAAAPTDTKKDEEGAAEQARELVNVMSSTLVKELEKAGYTARRLRPGEARPTEGLCIEGVFAETDEQNRLRRAVIGAISGSGKMQLFVGVSNLARPEQTLYAFADPKGENKPGSVITVSSYAPVAKFEMPKSVTEKDVKDTAAAVAADLTVLLNANIAALTH